MDAANTSVSALRQTLRAKRRALSATEQNSLASLLCHQVLHRLDFNCAPQNIACYLSFDGEISAQPLMAALKNRQHFIYLPILTGSKIHFARDSQHRYLNRFGIAEPHHQKTQHANKMDVVFVPLVAFDKHSRRLGMGGGFYDRSFAFKHTHSTPKLYGLAFDFQCVKCLQVNAWDVPLDGVFTPSRFYNRPPV